VSCDGNKRLIEYRLYFSARIKPAAAPGCDELGQDKGILKMFDDQAALFSVCAMKFGSIISSS
jgi:hypothetical protein